MRAVALALCMGCLSAGCDARWEADARADARPEEGRGDPLAGRRAIERYDCGVCHVIPGITGASGGVGPPLTHFGRRTYVAGRLPNSAETVASWIEDAPAVDPNTAMPSVGASREEARDMAAYLRSLR
jgi:cytochrome c